MNADLSPVTKALDPVWKQIKLLFSEHHFLTILCGFFAVMLTISCYRFLRSISPALVALILLLIFGILVMHWISTRTEPAFLSPAIDFIAPFFPTGYRR
jgi:hypothetical protein